MTHLDQFKPLILAVFDANKAYVAAVKDENNLHTIAGEATRRTYEARNALQQAEYALTEAVKQLDAPRFEGNES